MKLKKCIERVLNFFVPIKSCKKNIYYLFIFHKMFYIDFALCNYYVWNISVESFKSLLLLGAKCIDLEIWDSKEGPHVRLEKMVKPLDLLEVLESINKYAFIISDMPLIISLRIHCNQTNQGRLAQMLTSVFKQKLLKELYA